MQTEFDQQRQTEDALTNVQAAVPFPLNPKQGTTIPSFYQDDKTWQDAAKSKQLVNPPSRQEINKQMWIGSFMTALMVGLTSKDPASAIAGGLWGAIAIHDHGNALRQRAGFVPQLLKDGYSSHAVRRWYDTGQEDGLNADRDDMLARDKFNEQNRDDNRNFAEGQRRFDENQDFRDEQAARTDQYRYASLGERRVSRESRERIMVQRMQLAERTKMGIAFDPSNPQARQIAQQIVAKATDGQRKAAAFANRIYRGLDIVDEMQGLIDPGRVGEISKAIGDGTVSALALDADEQRYANALSDVIAAIVRKDSGAAVTESEWVQAKAQYMPLYGDEAEVIDQKFESMLQRGADSEAESGGILEPMRYLAGQDAPSVDKPESQKPGTDDKGMPNLSYKQQLMQTYGGVK